MRRRIEGSQARASEPERLLKTRKHRRLRATAGNVTDSSLPGQPGSSVVAHARAQRRTRGKRFCLGPLSRAPGAHCLIPLTRLLLLQRHPLRVSTAACSRQRASQQKQRDKQHNRANQQKDHSKAYSTANVVALRTSLVTRFHTAVTGLRCALGGLHFRL